MCISFDSANLPGVPPTEVRRDFGKDLYTKTVSTSLFIIFPNWKQPTFQTIARLINYDTFQNQLCSYQKWHSLEMELFCILIALMSICWWWYHTIMLQDTVIGGNWVKSIWALSVLFLTAVYKFIIIFK